MTCRDANRDQKVQIKKASSVAVWRPWDRYHVPLLVVVDLFGVE